MRKNRKMEEKRGKLYQIHCICVTSRISNTSRVLASAVSYSFLTHGCCEATSASLCSYLIVGQLNNGKCIACFARNVCLGIGPFGTGNRAGARVRSFDLALKKHDKWYNSHGARYQKQLLKFFLSLSFDLIREPASTAFGFN